MKTGLHKIAAAGATLVASSCLPAAARAQCAMCNTAAGGNGVGRGLSISVLFLLGTLALVVLGFVLLVVRRAVSQDTRSASTE